MKLDERDLKKINDTSDALRNKLSERYDSLSDSTLELLTGDTFDNPDALDERHAALHPFIAEARVWKEAAVICANLLNRKGPEYATMKDLIEELDNRHHYVLERAPLLSRIKPGFFPHLVVAFCAALTHFRYMDKAVTAVEVVCAEIDKEMGWEAGWAIEAFKSGDKEVQDHATMIIARRGVAAMAARGFTPEGLAEAHKTAEELGIDAKAIGLPDAVDTSPAPERDDAADALAFALATVESRTGLKLDVSHLKLRPDGVYEINVSEDGQSVPAETDAAEHAEAELDGGCDNIPRASDSDQQPWIEEVQFKLERTVPRYPAAVPRDDADGVDRRGDEAVLRTFRDGGAKTTRFPFAPRNFGRRVTDVDAA